MNPTLNPEHITVRTNLVNKNDYLAAMELLKKLCPLDDLGCCPKTRKNGQYDMRGIMNKVLDKLRQSDLELSKIELVYKTDRPSKTQVLFTKEPTTGHYNSRDPSIYGLLSNMTYCCKDRQIGLLLLKKRHTTPEHHTQDLESNSVPGAAAKEPVAKRQKLGSDYIEELQQEILSELKLKLKFREDDLSQMLAEYFPNHFFPTNNQQGIFPPLPWLITDTTQSEN